MNWDIERAVLENPELAKTAVESAQADFEKMRLAKIVSDIEAFLTKYAVFKTAASLPLALWIIGTYFSTVFNAFAYLLISSPMPRCGKTRVEEMLEILCWNTYRGTSVSEAVLYRMITGEPPPTILLDEMEFLARSQKNDKAEAILQLLNAGYRKGQRVARNVPSGRGFKIDYFNTFCPKALAAIGWLPDSIVDRCMVITMQRRAPDEKIARFDFQTTKDETAVLRDALKKEMKASFADVSEGYRNAQDIVSLSDRDSELLRPLLGVAQAFCPERVPELIWKLELLCGEKDESASEDNFKTKLLADLRTVWSMPDESASSKDLIARLAGMDDSHWSGNNELNPRKLSRLLSGFGARSMTIRNGDGVHRGYRLDDLAAAWLRYLPKIEDGKVTNYQSVTE